MTPARASAAATILEQHKATCLSCTAALADGSNTAIGAISAFHAMCRTGKVTMLRVLSPEAANGIERADLALGEMGLRVAS